MKRRIAGILLTLIMLGATALAEGADYPTMILGTYEQDSDLEAAEPLEWLILEETDDAYFCVTKYAIDNVPYQDEAADTSWADSDLRAWLNGAFLEETFTDDERERIQLVTVRNAANPDHGTDGGEDTVDRVFLLDVQETNRYFPTPGDRLALPSEAARQEGIITVHDNCLWRLRTPGRSQHHAVVVLTTGEYDYCGLNVAYSLACVRPAMWVAK